MVEVNVSDIGVGPVLSQRSAGDQKLHPWAFFRCLTLAERSYDVGALVLALQEWQYWLEGAAKPFVIWTDHKNLAFLQGAKLLNSCRAQWALFVSRFELALTYRLRLKNGKLDALSRQFTADQPDHKPEPILSSSCVWRRECARPCAPLLILAELHRTPCLSRPLTAPRSSSGDTGPGWHAIHAILLAIDNPWCQGVNRCLHFVLPREVLSSAPSGPPEPTPGPTAPLVTHRGGLGEPSGRACVLAPWPPYRYGLRPQPIHHPGVGGLLCSL